MLLCSPTFSSKVKINCLVAGNLFQFKNNINNSATVPSSSKNRHIRATIRSLQKIVRRQCFIIYKQFAQLPKIKYKKINLAVLTRSFVLT